MMFLWKIRCLCWRILGIEYQHALSTFDHVYLEEDQFAKIDRFSYNNHAVVYRWSDAPVRIGKFCSISYHVKLIADGGNHMLNGISSHPFFANAVEGPRGITIGNDVWIGMGVTILNGVKIGNGVTIAAGAVVVSDIPDYCVAAGIPAKVIRKKCTEADAEKMNHIAWWNWTDDVINARKDDFNLSISEFIKKYELL